MDLIHLPAPESLTALVVLEISSALQLPQELSAELTSKNYLFDH